MKFKWKINGEDGFEDTTFQKGVLLTKIRRGFYEDSKKFYYCVVYKNEKGWDYVFFKSYDDEISTNDMMDYAMDFGSKEEAILDAEKTWAEVLEDFNKPFDW